MHEYPKAVKERILAAVVVIAVWAMAVHERMEVVDLVDTVAHAQAAWLAKLLGADSTPHHDKLDQIPRGKQKYKSDTIAEYIPRGPEFARAFPPMLECRIYALGPRTAEARRPEPQIRNEFILDASSCGSLARILPMFITERLAASARPARIALPDRLSGEWRDRLKCDVVSIGDFGAERRRSEPEARQDTILRAFYETHADSHAAMRWSWFNANCIDAFVHVHLTKVRQSLVVDVPYRLDDGAAASGENPKTPPAPRDTHSVEPAITFRDIHMAVRIVEHTAPLVLLVVLLNAMSVARWIRLETSSGIRDVSWFPLDITETPPQANANSHSDSRSSTAYWRVLLAVCYEFLPVALAISGIGLVLTSIWLRYHWTEFAFGSLAARLHMSSGFIMWWHEQDGWQQFWDATDAVGACLALVVALHLSMLLRRVRRPIDVDRKAEAQQGRQQSEEDHE